MSRARRLPDPPELPEGARPPWPPWYAPAALLGSLAALLVAGIPLLPVVLALGLSDTIAAVPLLVLLLVQDGLWSGRPSCSPPSHAARERGISACGPPGYGPRSVGPHSVSG